MKNVTVILVLISIIAIACYLALNSTSESITLTEVKSELTVKEAKKEAKFHVEQITDIPFDFDTNANVYNYRLGGEELTQVSIINTGLNDKKSFNLIFSPSKANLQDEVYVFENEQHIKLNDGKVACYFVKDLGERIVFKREGITYGLYHIIQFEDAYGEGEMISFAEQLINNLE